MGLVRYPTTLAPASGSVTVTTQCADNAHRTSSSLNVSCTSSGNWSGTTPQCECDAGYWPTTLSGRQFCEGIVPTYVCPIPSLNTLFPPPLPPARACGAKSVGLVRYPTTFGGSVATLKCADNAHSINSTMRVLCDPTGVWSNQTSPECLCDEFYREADKNGQKICEG